MIDELRKQVGQTFTLEELADAYRDADRWARATVEERAPVARLAARPRARPRRGVLRVPARRDDYLQ